MQTINTVEPHVQGGSTKVRAGRPKLPEHQRFAAFEFELLAEALRHNDYEHVISSLESLPKFGFKVEIVKPDPEWRHRT